MTAEPPKQVEGPGGPWLLMLEFQFQLGLGFLTQRKAQPGSDRYPDLNPLLHLLLPVPLSRVEAIWIPLLSSFQPWIQQTAYYPADKTLIKVLVRTPSFGSPVSPHHDDG